MTQYQVNASVLSLNMLSQSAKWFCTEVFFPYNMNTVHYLNLNQLFCPFVFIFFDLINILINVLIAVLIIRATVLWLCFKLPFCLIGNTGDTSLMHEKAKFVCFIYMQPQKVKFKCVQINMKQFS